MALIGDVIQSARTLFPDQTPTLGPPTGLSSSVISDTSSTLPAGTYVVQVTQFNNWGESNPAVLSNAVVAANNDISVTGSLSYPTWQATHAYSLGAIIVPTTSNGHAYICIVAGTSAGSQPTFPTTPQGTVNDGGVVWQEYGSSLPTGITKYRVYFGITNPTAWVESTTLPVIVSSPGTAGTPPTRSSAYNPDADGLAVSAFTVFKWLTDGIRIGIRLAGGIRDITGIGSTNTQGMVQIPGQWVKFDGLWFDGYPMDMKNKRAFFYRNSVSALSAWFDMSVISNIQIAELWPQPNRTSGQTTLASSMSATATTASATSLSGFVLPFGLVSIGTEIMSYMSFTGNQLQGLVRGLAGTTIAAHAAGEPVVELNIRMSGLRFHGPALTPGMASQTLTLPDGWDSILENYLLSKFREAEQDRQSAQQLMDQFRADAQIWGRSNRSPGPNQILGPVEREVYGWGSYGGGGWLLP